MEDWQKETYSPPHGEPDSGLWQVHIALEQSEREAIAEAAPQVVPAERVEIHTDITDGAEGDVLLALRVHATSSEEAIDAAADSYRRIRGKAGLPAAPTLVLGFISPWWQQNRIPDLGKEAIALSKQGRHDLAVIRSQTVCELAITKTLTQLLKDQHPDAEPARLIRRPATLRDDQSKAFLHMLTGQRIQDQEWWPRYVEHLKRRNAIVHEGLAVTDQDAGASIEVSLELRKWLLDIEGAPDVEEDDSN